MTDPRLSPLTDTEIAELERIFEPYDCGLDFDERQLALRALSELRRRREAERRHNETVRRMIEICESPEPAAPALLEAFRKYREIFPAPSEEREDIGE